MAHFNQNKHINTLIVSVLRSQQVQVELQNSINITYDILGNILQILDAENVELQKGAINITYGILGNILQILDAKNLPVK